MQQLQVAARAVDDCLRRLGTLASARRRGEQLATLVVGLNGACLERLIDLSPEPELLERDPEIAEVLRVHRPARPEVEVLDRLADQIDATMDAIEQTGVPGMVEAGRDLVAAITEIYGLAMARAFELLHGARHGDVIQAALADPLVASALVVYGLHPSDTEARAKTAIDEVNATLSDVGPHAVFSGLDDDGTVRISIEGDPVRDRWRVAVAVERAVANATPDAPGVHVENAGGGSGSNGHDGRATTTEVFIPLSSITRRGASPSEPAPSRWLEVPGLASVEPGRVMRLEQDTVRLLACWVDGDLYVAVDPFGDEMLELQLTESGPPTVQSDGGASFVFDQPLPVQHSGSMIEVAVP